MALIFDPAKDAANVVKHGISLARAVDLRVEAVVTDPRSYGEVRRRAYGWIDGVMHCLVYTVRDGDMRAISPRRARFKEYGRHVR